MSRKANYTDQALDNCIANFVDRESRKPTYSEIKKMCPLGVSNDRISSALRRAGDRAATNCSPIGTVATENQTAPLVVFWAASEEIC